jgi:sodium-dependent dicarboxylate transporter 2/3/5
LDSRWVKLVIAILLSGITFMMFRDNPDLGLGLSIVVLIATLWVTEAFHITFTALLIPVLTVLTGIFTVTEAFREFANPIIFLFLGGFALAAVMRKQEIDQRLACGLIRLAGGRRDLAILLLFVGTAFLSMWISNTATAAMILPLALGLLANRPYENNKRLYWFVLLGVAYSANIGGIGTVVGSPPNAIAAANADIDFMQWMSFGVPAVMIMLPLMLWLLWLLLRPAIDQTPVPLVEQQPLNREQMMTLAVFALTVLLWLLSKPICLLLDIGGGFDAIVAMNALLLIGVLRLASWKDIESGADWGVLLLFGGGLTLSAMMQATGASHYLAEQVVTISDGMPLVVFLLMSAALIIFLTEITSNTASSALLIPIFISIAQAMSLPPMVFAVLIAVGASCAFMLPVATPPNAIIYGSGYVPQRQMMRAGLRLNLVMILLVGCAAWLVLIL